MLLFYLLASVDGVDICSVADTQIISESYIEILITCLRNPVKGYQCVHAELPGISAVSTECEQCTLGVIEGSKMECFSTCLSGSASAECQHCWPDMDKEWRGKCVERVEEVLKLNETKDSRIMNAIPILIALISLL